MKKTIIASLIGGMVGVGLSYLLSCMGGDWLLLMNPVVAAIIGALTGGFLVSGGNGDTTHIPQQKTHVNEEQAKTPDRF